MEELVDVNGGANPSVGDRLGSNYVVGERIGRGGMGVVHRASTVGGDDLAVKFLRADLATDHKVVARFLQERHIFRQIRHQNVVEVIDLVAEGDVVGIVMEVVNGGDLRQRLSSGPIDPSLAVKLTEQIAAGLRAIHAADVVHRDLKPANILLSEQMVPKISDFGISLIASEGSSTSSTRMGTPRYLAPEGTDDRGADKPADVYALGVILFEMLTGRPPHQVEGAIAMMQAHSQSTPPRIVGVPDVLADLVDWMMAKDPAVRPSIEAVQRDLRALASSVSAEMVPEVVERQDQVEAAPAAQPPASLAPESASSASPAIEAARLAETGLVTPLPGASGTWADVASPESVTSGSLPTVSDRFSSETQNNLDAEARKTHSPMALGRPMAPAASALPQVAEAYEVPTPVEERLLPAWWRAAAVGAVLAAILSFGTFLVLNNESDAVETTNETDPSGPGAADGADGDLDEIGGADGSVPSPDFTTSSSTTSSPTTSSTVASTTSSSTTTEPPTTEAPTTLAPTTEAPTTLAPTTEAPTTQPPTTQAPTTRPPTTQAPTTRPPTTKPPTTVAPTTRPPTTQPPSALVVWESSPAASGITSEGFRVDFETNDVCGAAKITVSEATGGDEVGSYTQGTGCFGPKYAVSPGLVVRFGDFDFEPGVQYRVRVSVTGTESPAASNRATGTGSATRNLLVTLAEDPNTQDSEPDTPPPAE